MQVILQNDWFCPGGYRIRRQGRGAINIPDAYFDKLPKSAIVVKAPDPKNPEEELVLDHSDSAKAKLFGNDAAGARANAENNILARQANKEESDRLVAEREAFNVEREAFELAKLEQAKATAESQADDDEKDNEDDNDDTVEGPGEPNVAAPDTEEGVDTLKTRMAKAKRRSRKSS